VISLGVRKRVRGSPGTASFLILRLGIQKEWMTSSLVIVKRTVRSMGRTNSPASSMPNSG